MNEIKITPELLAELKEKAEKATPEFIREGAFIYGPKHPASKHPNGRILIADIIEGSNQRDPHLDGGAGICSGENDAAYIAAANPQVMLALIADNERLRHKEDFYIKAMAEYHQVAKMAWDGEIPSPLPGHESSEEKMIDLFEYLNCPACGGSGHVGDCDEAIQNLKCDIEKLRKENEELHANNYGPEILNDPQALTASYFAGAMSEGRKRNVENDKLQVENDKLKADIDNLKSTILAYEAGCNTVGCLRAKEFSCLEKEANWLAEVICKKHSDIRRNGFVPDCPTGRKCDNQCVQCWREAARKAVEENSK